METMILALGVDRYKMDDASGCKLTYVELAEVPDRPDSQQGYHAIEENLDYDVFDDFQGVGLYKAKYAMKPKTMRNGKKTMALSIAKIELMSPLNLIELV